MRAVRVVARVVLRTSRARTLLLLLVLSVSLGFGLFAATGARRTATAFDRFIAWSQPPDVTTGPSYGDTPIGQQLDELAALAPVLASERADTIAVEGIDIGGGHIVPPTRMVAVALEDLGSEGLERGLVLHGALPSSLPADAGVIDVSTADRFGLEVGDRVSLHIDAHAPMPIDIVAVISVPRAIPTLAGFQFGGIVLGPAFLAAHRDLVDPYEAGLSIWLRPGATLDDLQAAMEDAGLGDIALGPGIDTSEVGAERLFTLEATAMWVAALLALVVGLPIAYQLARRDAAANRRRIDIVLALGASRKQVVVAAALRGAVVAATATIGAAVGALVASPAIPVGLARYAEIDRGIHADLTVLLLAIPLYVVAVAGLTALATWRGAWPPRPAIVGRRAPRVAQVPVAMGARMATGSGGAGSIAGLGALVLMAVVLIGMSVTVASLTTVPRKAELAGGVWDAFLELSPDTADAIDERLDAMPEVRAHGVGGWLELDTGREQVLAISLPPVAGMPPALVRGRAPQGDGEVALGDAAMDRLGVGIGDELEVTVYPDPAKRSLVVTGEVLVAAPLFQSHLPDDAALVTLPPTFVGDPADRSELVRFEDGVDPEAAVDALLAELPPGSVQFAFGRGQRGDVIALQRLQGLVRALLAMAATLALASLVHQLLITTRRNARSLAILRALGFTPGDVGSAGAAHGLVVATVTAALALPLGVALGTVAWRYLAGELNVLPTPTTDVVVHLMVAVTVVVGASVLAAALARRSARGSVTATLRAE
jgi:hypothetical protein